MRHERRVRLLLLQGGHKIVEQRNLLEQPEVSLKVMGKRRVQVFAHGQHEGRL